MWISKQHWTLMESLTDSLQRELQALRIERDRIAAERDLLQHELTYRYSGVDVRAVDTPEGPRYTVEHRESEGIMPLGLKRQKLFGSRYPSARPDLVSA
jgi:hypothetical protein